jgi:hypothetical protein
MVNYATYITIIYILRCVGEMWVDQRKTCADICDAAQVTDINTYPGWCPLVGQVVRADHLHMRLYTHANSQQ